MASFNKDLSIFEKSRQCKALVLLDEIQQRRPESDLISFNAVIGACDKNGSRIRRWSCSMRDSSAGWKSDLISFDALMHAIREGSRRWSWSC